MSLQKYSAQKPKSFEQSKKFLQNSLHKSLVKRFFKIAHKFLKRNPMNKLFLKIFWKKTETEKF
jgi:hypothetical protein